MLRREADGVRWWIERERMLGRAVAPASVVLAWTTRVGAVDFVERADALARVVDLIALPDGLVARRLSANVYSGGDVDGGPWTEERHARFREQGSGTGLDWRWDVPDPGRPASYDWASGLLLSTRQDLESGMWDWALAASPGLFREGLAVDAAGETWEALLRAVAAWPETVWGAVFRDQWNQVLPYERYFPASATGATANADRQARGYYWANLLTARHLEAWGGGAALVTAASAAGLAAEQVGDAVLLRSPASLGDDHCGDTDLAAMRGVLDPVLPAETYVFYAGPPLKVLTPPGAAFRRIPPEIEFPWFEDMGEAPPYCQVVPEEGEYEAVRLSP